MQKHVKKKHSSPLLLSTKIPSPRHALFKKGNLITQQRTIKPYQLQTKTFSLTKNITKEMTLPLCNSIFSAASVYHIKSWIEPPMVGVLHFERHSSQRDTHKANHYYTVSLVLHKDISEYYVGHDGNRLVLYRKGRLPVILQKIGI